MWYTKCILRLTSHKQMLLVVLLLMIMYGHVEGATSYGLESKTAYACEDDQLALECQQGEVIRILRANYGRFTISVCNRQGQTEGWNLQCMSMKAKDIISERCDGRRSCDMSVSNHVFGDPCPATSKYAEVKYTCQLAPRDYTGTQTTNTAMPIVQRQMSLNGSPRPPQITSATALNPNQIEIVWTQTEPPTPIHTTVVYYKNTATEAETSTAYVTSGKSRVIDSLTPNTTYILFLKSFNTFGPSITSHTVRVTTPPMAYHGALRRSALATITPRTIATKPNMITYTKRLSPNTPPTTVIMDARAAKSKTNFISALRQIFTSMFSSKNTTNVNIKPTTVIEISDPSTTITEGTQLSAFIRVASSSGVQHTHHRNRRKKIIDDYEGRMHDSLRDGYYGNASSADWNSDNNYQTETQILGVDQEREMASSDLNHNHTSQNSNSQHIMPQQIVMVVSPTMETNVTSNIKMEDRKSSQEKDFIIDGRSENNWLSTKFENFDEIKDPSPKQNVEAATLDSSAVEKIKSLVHTDSNDSTEHVKELQSTLVPLLQRVVENDDTWWTKNMPSNIDALRQGHRQPNNHNSSKTVHRNFTASNAIVLSEGAGLLTKSDNTTKIVHEYNNKQFHHGSKSSQKFEKGNDLSENSALLPSVNQSAIEAESRLYQATRSSYFLDMHTLAPHSTGVYDSDTRLTTSRMSISRHSPDPLLIQKTSSFTNRMNTLSFDIESTSATMTTTAEPTTVTQVLKSLNIDSASNDRSLYKPQIPEERDDSESINGVVDKFCEERVHRGVIWPKTRFGRIAEKNCTEDLRGRATWLCLGYGWARSGPDITDCVSAWMERIDAQIERMVAGKEPPEQAAVALNEAMRDQNLTSGDLKRASKILLPKLAQGFQWDVQFLPSTIKIPRMKKFKKAFVSASSSLLAKRHAQAWENLSTQDQRQAATSLIMTMENTGFHIATMIGIGTSERTVEDNIILEVNVIDTQQASRDFTFPSKKYLSGTLWTGNSDSITISSNSLKTVGLKGPVSVVFTLYKNIEDLMQPQPNTISSMPSSSYPSNSEDDHNEEIIRDNNSIEKTRASTARIVNTKIIAASINSAKQKIRLTEPVRFTLHHLKPTGDAQSVCSFWDMDANFVIGRWSQDGCSLLDTNTSQTTCECDHLTNFAVLMDVTAVKLSQENEMALRVITFAGCVISVICLMLSWITFLVFKNLQCDRNTIHKNLVLCLLLAEIVFLAGISQTESKILCSIIACILHYLFLGAFAWMCLEGIQLYVMLVEVFEQEKSRVHFYYLFGYGAPAVIVAISAGVYHQGYGTTRHCWLTTENYFIWSFVGPALAVMIVNIIMLSIAIYIMCRHSNMSATIRDRSKAAKFSITESFSSMETFAPPKLRFPDLPAWLKGAIVLVVLLGLTWLLGVLYLSEESVVMAYFFTVLNSLQGMFIFVFHCLKNEKVQKEYRKVARRTSWLPNCIRVNYGGYTGVASSSPIGSSGSGNYLSKLFGQRNRNSEASTNSSAKPFLSNNGHRSGTENSTSKDSSNVPSSLNGYVYNPSYSTSGSDSAKHPFPSSNVSGVQEVPGSRQTHTANNYERVDDVALDLSEYVDCSVVDSEYVSEYCRHNMQISREEHRYSTGSEDSDSRKPAIPHNNLEIDNLSTLSLASSSKKPSSCVSSTDVLDQPLGDDLSRSLGEKLRKETLDPRLNLHQYIIPVSRKSGSNNNNNIDVKSINNEKSRSDNINASLNKLSKPIPSLSSIPEAQTSPQHSSAPNLQIKLDFTDKLSKSSTTKSSQGNSMTHGTSEPVYEEVRMDLSSSTSTKSSLPNLCLNGLTVDCGDNTDFSFPILKHSSETDIHFSPFKFSASN